MPDQQENKTSHSINKHLPLIGLALIGFGGYFLYRKLYATKMSMGTDGRLTDTKDAICEVIESSVAEPESMPSENNFSAENSDNVDVNKNLIIIKVKEDENVFNEKRINEPFINL